MAVVTRGYTYAVNGQLTNTNLHTLVDGATVTNIVRGDANSDTSFITIQTTAPTSPKTGEFWYDTTSAIARVYDGTNWVILGKGELLTNKSGGQLTAGTVCVVYTGGTDRAFTTTTTAKDTLVIGVLLATTANNAAGVVLGPGSYCPQIKVDGTTAAGNYLSTSTTVGKATPSASSVKGVFGIAMSADSGGFCSGILVNVSGLQGSSSVQDALDNAVTPSSSVPFLTKQGAFGPQASVITSSSNFTATKTGMHKITVVGGGGGGGSSSGGPAAAGGGGGAGETRVAFQSLTKDSVYAATIGAAGAAGSAGNGGAGGNSSFAGTATVTANGGSGGAAAKTGGAGGTGGSNGDLVLTGGDGESGEASTSAGNGGMGGASFLGGGGRGGLTDAAGLDGKAYGSGGGGSGSSSGATIAAGAGKAGVVIVEYVG